jgi:hypothetical protein
MPLLQDLKDIFITDDGDVEISPQGDFRINREEDVVSTECLFRLKTTKGDWVLVPECGASLELLIGEANSPETGALMEAMIDEALTHDGFLRGEIDFIKAVPLNKNELMAIVNIQFGDLSIMKTVTLDLVEGVLSHQ